MEQVFSKDSAELLEAHLNHLLGSAISRDVITERGYQSILSGRQLEKLGFSSQQRRSPGILIPLHGTDGKPAGWQYRPDHPRLNPGGKPVKYENPQGTGIRLDCPPRCQSMLGNPEIPIFFVEGVKKADSLASRGCCAVTLSGVWNFKGRNALGGTTVLADFDYITFKGREVNICYDSDYRDNPSVNQALYRLAEHLRRKGCSRLNAICLPQGHEGKKTGVDDYLAEGHTVEEVLALATPVVEMHEEEAKQVMTAFFVHDNRLYLEIRRFDGTYSFAYLKDGKVMLTAEVKVGDHLVRPRPLPIKEGLTVEFVGMPDENLTVAKLLSPVDLYAKVKSHIRLYADLSDLDLELCVYYILFTWFYPKVNTLGYLRLLGDTGKGKSRIQKVVGDLGFYPVYAAGASSFSGTARQADKWRGTLIIDEGDIGGDKESQFIKYLNLGFEKDKYYVLSDKQNPRHQEFFNPFCPKILAMREPFNDNATEGRLLSISPHETQDSGIPIILLSGYNRETQLIRNHLAVFAMRHWAEVDGEKMVSFNDLVIEPRLKQLGMPLSIIFQLWPEGIKGFKAYLTNRQKEIKKTRSISWEGSLVNLVISIATGDLDLRQEFAEYYETESKQVQAVTPSMVARNLKSSVKAVTRGLISVGFEVERTWIDIFKDGEKSRKQVRCYRIPDYRVWREITNRYYYDEGDKKLEIPGVLCSSKFPVCQEVSHPSQPSQKHTTDDIFVTHVTDVTVPSTRPSDSNDVVEA